MKPSSLIKEASDRLVDQEPGFEYTTWKKEQLLAAFNWAVSIIADLKPETFATPMVVTLTAGSSMKVEDCDQFLPPYVLLDKNGRFVRDLVQGTVRGSLRTRKLCGGDDGPYYFNKRGESSFEVFPPLELDDAGWQVEGQCASAPQAQSEDEDIAVPGHLRAVVLELMMHYAHMYDTEATTSRDRAAVHWNNAMSLINPTGGTRRASQ